MAFTKYLGLAALLLSTGTLANPISYDRQSAKLADAFKSQGPSSHPQLRDYLQSLRSRFGDRQITVHLISHTHDDVGWLKTVDEYFTGTN